MSIILCSLLNEIGMTNYSVEGMQIMDTGTLLFVEIYELHIVKIFIYSFL
jgi:hypothetical protein